MTKPERAPLKSRISYQGLLLGGIATLCTVLLVVGNLRTKDEISERHAEDLRASLGQVILPELHDNNLLSSQVHLPYNGATITVYRATKEGKVTGLAYQMTGFGYGGAIVLMMAVAPNGEILGVRVLSHSETPGLGDNIEVAKSPWITRFNGHSFSNTPMPQWAVKKDGGIFDQFSGATITPRAVVKTIKEGLEFFQANREQLLAPPAQ